MQPSRPVVAASVAFAIALGATLGVAAPGKVAPVSRGLLDGGAPHAGERLAKLGDRVFGRSGALRVVMVEEGQALDLPMTWETPPPGDVWYRWEPLAGTRGEALLGSYRLSTGLRAPASKGIWRLSLGAPGWSQQVNELSVITRVPFAQKRGGYLNGYRIGRWETEGEGRQDRYAPPSGFIEVTPDNQDMLVSEHFKLRNFLTKDQHSVWPKYLALDLRLIDKLELVIQELNTMGIRAQHVTVMSGFRTPAYNIGGVGEGGRALLSRHTYGDASDVWVDNDHDGYMDDLNGDGRRDTRDAEVILRAVDRVEAQYPELVGGVGVYRDNGAHGPFVHIDARGYRARW
jgi:uncharacterized protein YcbK (DUF882 family)